MVVLTSLEFDIADVEMTMWRPLLISTIFALTIPSSATHSSTLLLNTSLAKNPLNITNPALEVPAEITRFTPWPSIPYRTPLSGYGLWFLDLSLYIPRAVVESSPTLSVPELCHFLQDFADNVQREYPVPGFVPRHTSQSTIDISSYKRWSISVTEGPWHGRLPTAVLLAVLNELGKLLRLHGPSKILWFVKVVGSRFFWAYGDLGNEKIMSVSINESSSNGNGGFQTI